MAIRRYYNYNNNSKKKHRKKVEEHKHCAFHFNPFYVAVDFAIKQLNLLTANL